MKMTCNEAVQNLVDYLHGELETSDKNKMVEHIENCRKCCGKVEFEEKLTKIIRKCSCHEKTPEHLKGKVLDCLRKEM